MYTPQMFNGQMAMGGPASTVVDQGHWDTMFNTISADQTQDKGKGRLEEVNEDELASLDAAFAKASLEGTTTEELTTAEAPATGEDLDDYMSAFERSVTHHVSLPSD